MTIDPRSERNLQGVHPDLKMLFASIDLPFPVVVIEGVRSLKKQREYVESGASDTMNSRHLKRRNLATGKDLGHAIDIAAFPDGIKGKPSWDWHYYADLAAEMKRASKDLGIPITWGGDWASRDGLHFQLTWAAYPVATRVAEHPDMTVHPLLPETPKPLTKRPETSTTVAAAGGVSALAIGQQVMTWLDGVDTAWSEYAVLAVILIMAGYIVKERVSKFSKEGI